MTSGRVSAVLMMTAAFAGALGAEPAAASRVETIAFKSAMVGASLPYNVILPADYAARPDARYPVLYLLHGLSDHYSAWVTRTSLVDVTARRRMIVVTPEGNNGWYTDAPTTPAARYESYLLEELIPDVQKRYRTIEEGYARGIAGLSMGGYGAMKIALKRPGQFAFAASLSGALNAAQYTERDGGGWALVWESVRAAFGPVASPTRGANDLFAIVRNLPPSGGGPLPYLYLTCGTEDDLVKVNRDFVALLLEKKLPHEYHQVPGIHDWELWEQQIGSVLDVFGRKVPRR